MLIKDALIMGRESLKLHNSPSYNLDAQVLLSKITGLDRTQLLLRNDQVLSDKQVHEYRCLLDRRAGGEPIAYLIGHKEFMGLNFLVTPDVLIPRPDTELLVEAALEFLRQEGHENSLAIDVGTGSGAIAISLAHLIPGLKVQAIDLSERALKIAQQNATTHGVADRVHCQQGNLLKNISKELQGKVSVITANLPYIPTGDINGLMVDVKDYEPHLALDGGLDGLDLYRQLIPQAHELLRIGGILLMEIGPGQGLPALAILPKEKWSARVANDLAGRERLVIATKVS